MIILSRLSVFLPSLKADVFLCRGAQQAGSCSGKQRWDAPWRRPRVLPRRCPMPELPPRPFSLLAGQFGGQLRVFYPFYCIDMLYMTSPIINISYSRICVEGAKSLPLSKVAGSSAEVRAPACCPKCPLLPFPFLFPNKPLPGAAESCD